MASPVSVRLPPPLGVVPLPSSARASPTAALTHVLLTVLGAPWVLRQARLLVASSVVAAASKAWPSGGKAGGVATLLLPVCGGKGGFGTLLKGAAKKKVAEVNQDACRQLDGRRVAEGEAERKLAEWNAQENQRKLEKEAEKFVKQKERDAKREREVDGKDVARRVEEESAAVTAAVSDAVRASLKAAEATKRKRPADEDAAPAPAPAPANRAPPPKRKRILGLDDDDDDDSDGDGEE